MQTSDATAIAKLHSTILKSIELHITNRELEQAQALINQHREDILKNDDTAIILHTMQSLIFLLQNKSEECISYAAPLLAKFTNSNLYTNIANAYEKVGNIAEAIKHYRCAQFTSLSMPVRFDLTKRIAKLQFADQPQEAIDQYVEYLRQCKLYVADQVKGNPSNSDPSIAIKVQNPFKGLNQSIFLGTMEIANHLSQYTRVFRQQGRQVFSLNYYPNYLAYDIDLNINIKKVSDKYLAPLLLLNTIDGITEFEYFHYIFNTTLLPKYKDIEVLKSLNKKVFMHNLGSEIRLPSIAKTHHPYWVHAEEEYLDNLSEEKARREIEHLSTYIDNVIVSDHEMYSYVEGSYKNSYILGLPITLDEYPVSPTNNEKLVLVHAPTNPTLKGSTFFSAAIESLKKKYDFEYIEIQGYSHEEAKEMYKKADIILDELIIGTYGSLTIESLSLGKCVVTYLCDKFTPPHGELAPIQIANVDNLEEKIEELLASPELRERLSREGRAYVEKYCDARKVCDQIFDIYTGKTKPHATLEDPANSEELVLEKMPLLV